MCIAVVLVGLGVAVFTVDMTNIFISVSAPVQNGNRADRISVMFVVENDARFLNEIIDLLEDRDNVDANFFIGGQWAINNRDTVKRIADRFEIGNHGMTNRNLALIPERDQNNEIQGAHDVLADIIGEPPSLFLPPNGSFNNRTLRVAERLGYRTVMWSRDASTALQASSGDFVMLRPSLATLTKLNSLLHDFNNRNLQVIRISENM